MSGFIVTPEHEEIFDCIRNNCDDMVIEAVAGSGKTSTILESIRYLDGEKTLFLAFNRNIAGELKDRVKKMGLRNVWVQTCHSYGLSTLKKNLDPVPEFDDNKLRSILREVIPGNFWKDLMTPVRKMVGLAKGHLTEDPKDILELAINHNIDLNFGGEEISQFVVPALELCAERKAIIDFDDMIWLPLKLGLRGWTYPVVFIDEAQDLNPAQMELVDGARANRGRIIAVGDRHQSIYAFRGADTQAIPNLIERFDAEVFPLTKTRRCPKRIVEMAKQIVPHLEAVEDAPEGVVSDIPYWDMVTELADTDRRAREEDDTRENMVLCRCVAPLVPPVFELLRRGQKAIIRGKDIGKNLINLVHKLKADDLNDLTRKLTTWRDKEIVKLINKEKEHLIPHVEDKVETMFAIMDGVADINELKIKLEDLFSDKTRAGVVFSSIHKAKGLEAERIWILRPDLMPHPRAKKPWEKEQEGNLRYVAYTRSKSELYLVIGDGDEAQPIQGAAFKG